MPNNSSQPTYSPSLRWSIFPVSRAPKEIVHTSNYALQCDGPAFGGAAPELRR